MESGRIREDEPCILEEVEKTEKPEKSSMQEAIEATHRMTAAMDNIFYGLLPVCNNELVTIDSKEVKDGRITRKTKR